MKIASIAMLMIAAGLMTGCSAGPMKSVDATLTEVKVVKGSKEGIAGAGSGIAAANATTTSGLFGAMLFGALTKSSHSIVYKFTDENGKDYYQSRDFIEKRFEGAKAIEGKKCLLVTALDFSPGNFSSYCDEKSIEEQRKIVNASIERHRKKQLEEQAEKSAQ